MNAMTVTIATLFLFTNAAHASEEIHLKCLVLGQDKAQHEIISIYPEKEELRFHKYGESQTFYFSNSDTDTIYGIGKVSNRHARLKINRVSGLARFEELMTDEDKPKLYNERTRGIGYPLNEIVWLGYDLECTRTNKLF